MSGAPRLPSESEPHDESASPAAGAQATAEGDAIAAALADPARLAAVRAAGGSGTPALERLARLAARALRAPVGQVNVVTADTQVPLATATHAAMVPDGDPARWTATVGLESSFCQHLVVAVADGEPAPLLIEDARVHPLVRENRATVDGGIVAYAGAPLRSPDGHVLGSVCVVDFAPRAWTDDEAAMLRELAALASDELAGWQAAETALERQGALTALVAENATAALFLMDRDGHPTYMNAAAERMTGFTLAEIAGMPLHYAVHHRRPDGSPYPMAECPIDRALPEHFDVRAHEDVFIRKDGEFFPVMCAASPILENGVPVGTVVEVRDVTLEKAAEDELRRLAADLEAQNTQLQEQQVGLELANQQLRDQATELELQTEQLQTTAAHLEEQTAEADQQRAAAEAANRAKSQFLSTMSHELRTPLNAIGGYAELLELGVRGPVSAEQLADLSRIRRANQHLQSLINDILNFARLEVGQVQYALQDVVVEDALADVEVLVLPQLRERGLTYRRVGIGGEGDRSVTVHADAEKLRQILLNLLTNAIKFTAPGGHVTLGGELDPARPDVVKLFVADTGRGIPAGELDTVFEPFVQVDRHLTGASQQGVGLGLAISRDLARGMGGELSVESRVGEGSTFAVVLPTGHGSGTSDPNAGPRGAEARAAADVTAVVRSAAAALSTDGAHAVLRDLNARTEHRFTGLYRFDAPMLRNIALYDRESSSVRVGAPVPMRETYCAIVGETEQPFATADAQRDSALAAHPAREAVVAYCGALVRDADGRAIGTLCHFDAVPRAVPAAEIPVLEAVAGLLATAVRDGG